jgi:hypothetical protein
VNLMVNGLGINDGIVKGHLNVQVAEIAPPVALGQAQRLTVRVSHQGEPRFVIEPRGFDHQRVALPSGG